MTIENGVVEEVIRAIKSIQDTRTQNEDRIRYTQAIELIKDGPTNQSIPIAFALVVNEDKSVAHVGWLIIEHVVKYKWLEPQLLPETRLQIRNGVLEYISESNSLMTPANVHLRTAISRTIVSIIEQEWPRQWPEMFNQFSSIVANPNYVAQCQMIFEILERLIEDIYTLVTVENQSRRKDLQNAISSHAGQLIQMTLQRLRLCIATGIATEQNCLLAKSAITLLGETFEWINGKLLADSVDGIIEVLCAYLQVETCRIYETAASALYKLSARKKAKADELPVILSMFRSETMQSILTACTLAASSSNTSEEHYKYLKLLCDLLCVLGIGLADVWTHLVKPPDTFNLYLNALTEFFKHPSLYIRLETSQVLLAFSANASINRYPTVLEKMPAILLNLPQSMEKIDWLNNAQNNPTSQYFKFDYDNASEFLQDYMRLRERCNRLIRENMEPHFTVLSSIVTTWIDERFVRQTSAISATEWDSMKRYLVAYMQAIHQLGMIKKDAKNWLVILMDKVFNHFCNVNDPVIVNEMLSILSAFFVVLESEPTRIPPILDLLKRLLLTRHCINLLLKLVTTLPTCIKQYVQTILDVVVTVAPLVSSMQKANLVQVLAALSNVTDGIDNQRVFLTAALQDVIAFFESSEFQMCLNSPGLFSYIGAYNEPMSDEEARGSSFHINRVKLKSQLSSIDGALSQVLVPSDKPNPLFEMCVPVVRNVFQFIRCLNSIYNEQTLSTIHPAYKNGLFTLSSLERQTIIYSSTGGLDVEESQTATNAQQDGVAHMRKFFTEVGDLVQNIVGLVGSKLHHNFYDLADSQKLIECAFSNADHIPDFRLRFWIKRAWSPLISSCPASRASVVIPITASLCRHMHALLTSRWNIIKSFDEDDVVTEEEMFSQQMVYIVTREYAGFLNQLLINSTTVARENTKKAPEEVLTPLAMELLRERTIFEPIIASICLLINCPDTKTVMKMIPVAQYVIKSQYINFNTEMATNTLVHSIRSLQVNGGDEVCLGPLLNFAFTVYSLLRPNHPALLNVLEQVPKLPDEVLKEFDEKIITFAYNKPNSSDKNRKDTMRKILKTVIANKISEEFRRSPPSTAKKEHNMNTI
ncbi:Exportin-5 [Aphelenchoides bicaudatus]|nr:Exportin-5 [Aphelenchoides bicaudatus]